MATASFDVFDTLLTRIWAEPSDLFLALGELLHARDLTRLSPVDFAALRQKAERAARDGSASREISLADIYRELASWVGWKPEQSEQALREEIALETQGVRAVPGAGEKVQRERHRCGRVIFLSDMYLPSGLIQEWLVQGGFFQAGDLLLVSGESGAGKGTGGLFRIAREKAQAAGDWTHRGDHPVADGAAPRALGIEAVLDQTVHLQTRERGLRGPGRYVSPWRSRLAGAARLARLDADPNLSEQERNLWTLGATVAGPLFLGFTRWCLDEAARQGLTELHFLARGGQIFHRIADLLPKPAELRCHYLHTSRLAFAGAFDLGNEARLRQLGAPSLAHHSVRQAFTNLGLDETLAGELPAQWPRSRWDENLPPKERQALADWLLAPERKAVVRAALAARAERARAYLLQSGLGAGKRAGLVDTGWMGTIQKNIEHLLAGGSGAVPLHGFYLGLSPVREFECAGPCQAYTNTFQRLSLRRETTHLILLELMARGDHGPLLGFTTEGSRIVPSHGPVDAIQQ
ncbi:MAG TPA: hypothetical protein VHN79_10015, partial [Lacunisphaera sp.]|nr:hypothetical protein [Lacunisphaera sp.]